MYKNLSFLFDSLENKIIETKNFSLDVLKKWFVILVTRGFGILELSLSLVPVLDLLNHSNNGGYFGFEINNVNE